MGRELTLFAGTFTTLLAIINPLEVLPVYLKLLAGKDEATHRAVAWKACLYSLLLCFFFFIFGAFILRLFGVPLSMLRIVGGIILMKIGFELFMPKPSGGALDMSGANAGDANIAFVPLAMPLMFGPGGIATIIGMTATIKDSSSEIGSLVAISAAGCSRQSRKDGRRAGRQASRAPSSMRPVGGKPAHTWRPAAAPCSVCGGRPMPRICAHW